MVKIRNRTKFPVSVPPSVVPNGTDPISPWYIIYRPKMQAMAALYDTNTYQNYNTKIFLRTCPNPALIFITVFYFTLIFDTNSTL